MAFLAAAALPTSLHRFFGASVAASTMTPVPSPREEGVRILAGLDWLDEVVALHKSVRDAMPEAMKHCLMPKSLDYFRALLSGEKGVLFGLIVEGEVVGLIAGCFADSLDDAKTKHLISAPDSKGLLADHYRFGKTIVAQALCVSKKYGSRGYSHALIKSLRDWALINGFTQIYAQAAQENPVSWMRFMSYDFALVESWMEPHAKFLMRWMNPVELALCHASATSSTLSAIKKDRAALPALLVMIEAMLRGGKVALASGAGPFSPKLDILFAEHPRARHI